MKVLITSLVSVFLICAAGSFESSAQDFVPAKVEKTQEKVKIGSKIYYAHKVVAKQTLYSISKAYGVSMDEINAANPSLASGGLKSGMIIYIPAEADTAAPQTSGVGKSNDVTGTQKAEEPSPKADDKKKKSERKTAKSPKYRKYNVKWYESLDDVAVKFNVSVEAIYALNKIDPEAKKRIRSILIPDKAYMESLRSGIDLQDDTDTALAFASEEQTGDTENIDVAQILPFQGTIDDLHEMYDDGLYTISIIMPFNTDTSTDVINNWYADFYSGALIAVDSLKKAGKFDHFTLRVIDLSDYNSSWELVASNTLQDSELIIGPVSERDIHPIAVYAKERHIPIVSPLDLKTAGLAHENPYFFLFPPQTSQAVGHQIKKIATPNIPGVSEAVTVIYEKGYENSDKVIQALAELDSANVQYKVFSYDFLSGRGINSVMIDYLDPVRLNKVLIPSTSASFVNDAMRNLNLIQSEKQYNITVYGLSQWKSMESLENEYFHSLDLRLVMSYYNDYNDPATKEFIRKYKEVFNTYPTSFSYQGYDIMTFFVEAMYEYGKDYPARIINKRKSLLQSDVLFLPIEPGCGYWNIAFKDICYQKGWKIVEE